MKDLAPWFFIIAILYIGGDVMRMQQAANTEQSRLNSLMTRVIIQQQQQLVQLREALAELVGDDYDSEPFHGDI